MSVILEFIRVFNSPSNVILFTECACYYFSIILHHRFENSTIMYNPHQVHFATRINGNIYDITGLVEDSEDYVVWEDYQEYADDADMIIRNCIDFERR